MNAGKSETLHAVEGNTQDYFYVDSLCVDTINHHDAWYTDIYAETDRVRMKLDTGIAPPNK